MVKEDIGFVVLAQVVVYRILISTTTARVGVALAACVRALFPQRLLLDVAPLLRVVGEVERVVRDFQRRLPFTFVCMFAFLIRWRLRQIFLLLRYLVNVNRPVVVLVIVFPALVD